MTHLNKRLCQPSERVDIIHLGCLQKVDWRSCVGTVFADGRPFYRGYHILVDARDMKLVTYAWRAPAANQSYRLNAIGYNCCLIMLVCALFLFHPKNTIEATQLTAAQSHEAMIFPALSNQG